MDEQRATSLAQLFGCVTGTLPFTYLGLPLGLSKPKVIDCLPLVSKCEKRLSSTYALLSQAGRLEVTNAIFSTLPMYFMSTFRLHKMVIQQIDKYIKHCLWRGSDINAKNPPRQHGNWFAYPKKKVA